LNGWRFWRCTDAQGQQRLLDELRQQLHSAPSVKR
jgi:hypothetical protein